MCVSVCVCMYVCMCELCVAKSCSRLKCLDFNMCNNTKGQVAQKFFTKMIYHSPDGDSIAFKISFF